MLSELYKETLGEYNPEEEMKIGAIATRLQAIQLAK